MPLAGYKYLYEIHSKKRKKFKLLINVIVTYRYNF
jgi:hypothetical protein